MLLQLSEHQNLLGDALARILLISNNLTTGITSPKPLYQFTILRVLASTPAPRTDLLTKKENSVFGFPIPRDPPLPELTRLAPFLPNWHAIRSDAWVLTIITTGYRIEIESLPPIRHFLPTPPTPELFEEIQSLLLKFAIEQLSQNPPPRFYSRYFTIPPKDGGLRPILDLRVLNQFIRPEHFWMTKLEDVIPLLKPLDWFTVIDLKDAYFHITIREDHRKYLQFAVSRMSYQFCSLPFILSTAPRVFTKCLAPVVAYLRLQGIAVFPYLDYWLLVAPTKEKANKDTLFTLHLLEDLGLQVNWDKSNLVSSTQITYIGAALSSIKARAFLPAERFNKIPSAYSTLHTKCFNSCTHTSAALGAHGIHHIHDPTCLPEDEVTASLVPPSVRPTYRPPK